MSRISLSLVEFPADDPERARRFWTELLGVELTARAEAEGEGWQTRPTGAAIGSAGGPGGPATGSAADPGSPAIGVDARGRGPGDSFSLPYFAVADIAAALERVQALGGSVVHPGVQWAICKDSEGTPFALACEPVPAVE